MLATQRWKQMVQAEHAQSERAMGGVSPPEDRWRPYAQQFKSDPRRTGDGLVNRLLEEVAPHHTLLDVGAGGGRLALPAAIHCRSVVAVEPSPSMGEVLRQQASESSISNVSVVQARWEEAEVEPADLVLCAHVLYVVADIEPFVRKLEDHARERVLVVLFNAPPQSQIHALWEQIHGEARIPLPSLPELQAVLGQMGIDAKVEMLAAQPAGGFDDVQQALELLARRLYLEPGSPQMATLENMLPDLLEESDGTLIVRGSQPLLPGLVSWRSPRRMTGQPA